MKRLLIYPLIVTVFVAAVVVFSVLYGAALLLDREDRGAL